MKISPVGAELFRADGQTDSHDEANNHFPQFPERVEKLIKKENIGVQSVNSLQR